MCTPPWEYIFDFLKCLKMFYNFTFCNFIIIIQRQMWICLLKVNHIFERAVTAKTEHFIHHSWVVCYGLSIKWTAFLPLTLVSCYHPSASQELLIIFQSQYIFRLFLNGHRHHQFNFFFFSNDNEILFRNSHFSEQNLFELGLRDSSFTSSDLKRRILMNE